MKQGHYFILYLMIYFVCFISIYAMQKQYDAVLEEKYKMEAHLRSAIEEAVWALSEVLKEDETTKKAVIEQSFFEMLSISMGTIGSEEAQQMLRLYVPMLVLIEEDGMCFYHIRQETVNELQYLVPGWTQKIYYEFAEDCRDAQKKEQLVAILEKSAKEYISNHNYIARQYGISYQFHVPDFLGNTGEKIYFPMLVAVFQGWPLITGSDLRYENCIDAAVYLQEKEYYLVEVPCGLEQTNAYYHAVSCKYAGHCGGKLLEQRLSKQQAILQYGALQCPHCAP